MASASAQRRPQEGSISRRPAGSSGRAEYRPFTAIMAARASSAVGRPSQAGASVTSASTSAGLRTTRARSRSVGPIPAGVGAGACFGDVLGGPWTSAQAARNRASSCKRRAASLPANPHVSVTSAALAAINVRRSGSARWSRGWVGTQDIRRVYRDGRAPADEGRARSVVAPGALM